MASPNTAGVAALVLSARPGLTALDIKNAIMGSVDAKPELAGKAVTGGRVNADRAVVGHAGRRARERLAADHHRPHPPGRDAQHVHRPVEPAGSSYAYLWQRSLDNGATWTTIAGATGSTYVPGASDIGALLRSTVVATNPFGVASATSTEVGPVTSGAPVITGRAVIIGTPRRGQTLPVNASWNPAGTTYAYQWERSADGGVTWDPIGTSAADLHAHHRRARRPRCASRSPPPTPTARRSRRATRSARSRSTRRSTPTRRRSAAPACSGRPRSPPRPAPGAARATPSATSGSARTAATGRRSPNATTSDLPARQGGRGPARARRW